MLKVLLQRAPAYEFGYDEHISSHQSNRHQCSKHSGYNEHPIKRAISFAFLLNRINGNEAGKHHGNRGKHLFVLSC